MRTLRNNTGRPAAANAHAEAAARMAEIRNRSRAQQQQSGGGGGGGGGGDYAEPLKIGEQEFFRPRGIPGKSSTGKVIVEAGPTWIDKDASFPAVLFPATALQFADLHRVLRAPGGPAVLSGFQANKPTSVDYPCTFNENAGPARETYSPSDQWVQTQESVSVLGQDTPFLTAVVQLENGMWGVDPPACHRYLAGAADNGFPEDLIYEDQEEAMWTAESLYAEARSCVHCAQAVLESRDGVRDGTVWHGAAHIMLPYFGLNWLMEDLEALKKSRERSGGNKDRTPRGSFRHPESLSDRPGRNQTACVAGYGHIPVPLRRSKGGRWRTLESYNMYLHTLSQTCTNCLGPNGERTGHRNHKLELIGLVSPAAKDPEALQAYIELCEAASADDANFRATAEAAGVIKTPFDLMNMEAFREPDEVDGVPNMQTAGVYQWTVSVVECPFTGAQVVPEPVYSCSSCKDPRPMQPHECVTRITRDQDGSFRFERVQGEGGRIFYPDFSSIPATNPPVLQVEGFVREGLDHALGGTFQEYLPIVKGGMYPQLTPEQQDQLMGTDLLGTRSRHATASAGHVPGRRR